MGDTLESINTCERIFSNGVDVLIRGKASCLRERSLLTESKSITIFPWSPGKPCGYWKKSGQTEQMNPGALLSAWMDELFIVVSIEMNGGNGYFTQRYSAWMATSTRYFRLQRAWRSLHPFLLMIMVSYVLYSASTYPPPRRKMWISTPSICMEYWQSPFRMGCPAPIGNNSGRLQTVAPTASGEPAMESIFSLTIIPS